MAGVKPYPEYKDSGVEWIGEIPKDWNKVKVGHVYEITLGKMLQTKGKSKDDKLIPYLKANNVQENYINYDSVDSMYANSVEVKKYELRKNDLLVCEGGEVARSAFVDKDLNGYIFQNALHRVRKKENSSLSYLHYLLFIIRKSGFINVLVNKATIAHFTKDKFSSLEIPFPSLSVQKKISFFLNKKASEIDSLISDKERLIELLEEKRQAIITETVTKGLDQNVKMKDSGIEWIGEIPEYWNVTKLNRISDLISDGLHGTPKYSVEGDYYFINGNNLRNKRIEIYNNTNKVNKEEFYKHKKSLNNNTILISLNGTIGNLAFYNNEAVILGKSAGYINLKKGEFKEYIYYVLKSNFVKNNFNISLLGTTIPNLSLETLRNTLITFPPKEEQQLIVKYLDRKYDELDNLIIVLKKQIAKLNEYRESLIYEAVTGKIDLRDCD